MKIFFSTALLFAVMAANSFAQNNAGTRLSIGPELSFTNGKFSNTHSFGLGATVQVEFRAQQKLSLTAGSGILFYTGKSIAGVSNAKYGGINIVPVRLGAKYFIFSGLYGGLQLGVGFLNRGIGTAFAYSPQAGYEFITRDRKTLDLTVRYDAYSKNGTRSALTFRVAKVI
jgi:hypothetical protein